MGCGYHKFKKEKIKEMEKKFTKTLCYNTQALTFRRSIGIRSILATSSATLPWPRITAVSQSRLTCNCSTKKYIKFKFFKFF
jgi:hypothetical protein